MESRRDLISDRLKKRSLESLSKRHKHEQASVLSPQFPPFSQFPHVKFSSPQPVKTFCLFFASQNVYRFRGFGTRELSFSQAA